MGEFSPVAGIVVAVLVVAVLGWLISLYNGIVAKANRCDTAWQTVSTQLARRADLIPNLVETVKGYASHEQTTLEHVVQARQAIGKAHTQQEKMQAEDVLTQTIGRLFAVVESYPDLKANANFQALQSDLRDTEDKISYARMSFNDCVLSFNNAVTTFPGVIIAGCFGSRFAPKQGFELASPEDAQAPKVSFK